MVQALAVFIGIDYATGLAVALCGKSQKTENGTLSSYVSFQGLFKKAIIFGVIYLCTHLDILMGNSVMIFQTAAAFYYLANEGLSIVENAALLGVPFPPLIKNALEAMKKKGEEPKDETDKPE